MFWGVSPILDILGHLHMVRAIREYCKSEDHPETLTGCCFVLGISLEHDPLLSINQSGCLQRQTEGSLPGNESTPWMTNPFPRIWSTPKKPWFSREFAHMWDRLGGVYFFGGMILWHIMTMTLFMIIPTQRPFFVLKWLGHTGHNLNKHG